MIQNRRGGLSCLVTVQCLRHIQRKKKEKKKLFFLISTSYTFLSFSAGAAFGLSFFWEIHGILHFSSLLKKKYIQGVKQTRLKTQKQKSPEHLQNARLENYRFLLLSA